MRLRMAVCISVLLGQMVGIGVLIPGAATASSTGIVISQLQNAGTSKSTDEFIELANRSGSAVSIAGWQIQYRAASSTNGTDCTKGWTTKATVSSGAIVAGGNYLFAPSIYMPADTSFSAGLAALGTVRLLDASKTTQDSLAWGAASCGAGHAAAAPAAGQSLERHAAPAGNTGDNAQDFFVQASPVAHASGASVAVSAPASDPSTPSSSESSTPGLGSGGGLKISELLVDPVSPKTDAKDEFVELHNDSPSTLEGEGYVIKTGSHQYKLPKGTIDPDGYLVITSADSTISLTNSGGVANLLDPTGAVIDTAGAWGTAVPGASWADIDGTWLWTLSPTPGAANEYTPVPGTAGADGSADFAAVQLSELLPDPGAPLTDAADEFIEIFNPTDADVDLNGYVLKAGHDLASKYIIKNVTVPAGGYVAIKSATTKLALANDGSSVALYTPDGAQLGATVTYGKAGTGNAWARFNDSWGWTAEPTPGAENVQSDIVTAAAAKAAAAKSAKAAKASTAKAKAAAKPKAAKITKAPNKPLLAGTTTTGGRWLLFILAGLTIAYIIYEFRYDIRNYYYKFRGYPGSRPSPVAVAIEAGGDRAGQRPRRG